MDEDGLSTLDRVLSERLAGVRLTAPETAEGDYEQAVTRALRKVPAMRETVERNRARVVERYAGFEHEPEGRQATVLANSPPTMLLALAHRLMQESYEHRFDDPARSFRLASLAHQAAEAVAATDYLSKEGAADLVGESLDYLGNAKRLTSDVGGAERTLADAERLFERGTGDRHLRATHLGFLGALRFTQGRAEEAADVWQREATIWRLLKDPHKLGFALIGAGLAVCWCGDTLRAAKLIREGTEVVVDDRLVFLGLLHLAEAFARDGDGFQAWQLLCAADLVVVAGELGGGLTRRHRWVKAITYRSNGELPYAKRLLTAVRDEYIDNQEPLRAAFASLDLLAVLAAQGKHADVIPLAEATHRILVAEGIEQKALAAYMTLHRAALAEQLTEAQAVKVANFIVRRQHDRRARFE